MMIPNSANSQGGSQSGQAQFNLMPSYVANGYQQMGGYIPEGYGLVPGYHYPIPLANKNSNLQSPTQQDEVGPSAGSQISGYQQVIVGNHAYSVDFV